MDTSERVPVWGVSTPDDAGRVDCLLQVSQDDLTVTTSRHLVHGTVVFGQTLTIPLPTDPATRSPPGERPDLRPRRGLQHRVAQAHRQPRRGDLRAPGHPMSGSGEFVVLEESQGRRQLRLGVEDGRIAIVVEEPRVGGGMYETDRLSIALPADDHTRDGLIDAFASAVFPGAEL